MQAMMGMVKLNVKALKDAYAGKPAARRRRASEVLPSLTHAAPSGSSFV
jgi:hypothetical protein